MESVTAALILTNRTAQREGGECDFFRWIEMRNAGKNEGSFALSIFVFVFVSLYFVDVDVDVLFVPLRLLVSVPSVRRNLRRPMAPDQANGRADSGLYLIARGFGSTGVCTV
jgi:hypothetical protein